MANTAWAHPGSGAAPVMLRRNTVPLRANCAEGSVVVVDDVGGVDPAACRTRTDFTAGAAHTKPAATAPRLSAARRSKPRRCSVIVPPGAADPREDGTRPA